MNLMLEDRNEQLSKNRDFMNLYLCQLTIDNISIITLAGKELIQYYLWG